MTEPSNPEVLAAMAALDRGETPRARQALYDSLRAATFALPVGAELSEPSEDGQDIGFLTNTDPRSDRPTLVAFTDYEAANASQPPDRKYVVMPFAEVCGLVAPMGVGVRVNPGTVPSGIVAAAWIRAIAEGKAVAPDDVTTVAQRVSGSGVRVKKAPAIDAALRDRLMRGFASRPEVLEAYLAWGTFSDHECLTVGVVVDAEADSQRRGGLVRELFGWAEPALENEEMDFLALDGAELLLKDFKKTGGPIYRRS